MPTYEYLCQGCSYMFELRQRITDDPVATCTRCGMGVKRVISAPGIMFKGTGWYLTDYSNKLKPPAGESSESKSSSKKETAQSTSTTPAASAA